MTGCGGGHERFSQSFSWFLGLGKQPNPFNTVYDREPGDTFGHSKIDFQFWQENLRTVLRPHQASLDPGLDRVGRDHCPDQQQIPRKFL